MKHYNDISKTQRSYEIVEATKICLLLWQDMIFTEISDEEFRESFAKLTDYIEEKGSQEMKDKLEEWGDTDGWLSHTLGIYAMVLELVENTGDYQ